MANFHAMDPTRQWKCMKVSTVIGSVILILFNGLMMFWGNMSVYLASYFVFIHSLSHTELETTWSLSIFILFLAVGVIIYPMVSKFIGRRAVQVIGILIIDTGLFTCYFTVQKSVIVFIFTLSVCMGVGTGVLYASTMQLMVEWATNDMGFLFSVAQDTFAIGGVIVNQFITFYLNPLNEAPDFSKSITHYFSQKTILDKVPSMFLLLGVMSATAHLIGILLLRDNPLYERENTGLNAGVKDTDNGKREENILIKRYQDTIQDTPLVGNTASTSNSDLGPYCHEVDENVYKPKETLRTVTFYVTWIALFTSEYAYLVYYNFYKSFGQIWIHNDHFLTNIGTSMSATGILMRLLFGIFIDNAGPRVCCVVISFFGALISLWYYFTVEIDKWLFASFTVLESVLPTAFYISYPSLVVSVFGKTYFAGNYSCMKTTTLVINFVAPVVLREILVQYGWFYVFASAGISCIVSMTLFVWLVPHV